MKFGLFDHFFLISANLISRSSDISKYSREALGLRDSESRLCFSASFGEGEGDDFRDFLSPSQNDPSKIISLCRGEKMLIEEETNTFKLRVVRHNKGTRNENDTLKEIISQTD